jgi:hypothetical protein
LLLLFVGKMQIGSEKTVNAEADRKNQQRFFVAPSLPDTPQLLIKSIMSAF